MDNLPTRHGRPRRYDLRPLPDFANHDIAFAAAALDELRERVIDQIRDLPQDAISFCPQGTTLSIGALLLHLVWAEAGWVQRITACQVPHALSSLVTPAGKAIPVGQQPPQTTQNAAELVALCRQLRDEFTVPALQKLVHADDIIEADTQVMTARGVVYHLIWHWTYHSAHIGLLRELWGSDYIWTFGSLGISDALHG